MLRVNFLAGKGDTPTLMLASFVRRIPWITGRSPMATRNYRQAKRNREETRKNKQQEKLRRRMNRGAAPEAVQEVPATETSTEPKVSP